MIRIFQPRRPLPILRCGLFLLSTNPKCKSGVDLALKGNRSFHPPSFFLMS